MRKLRLAEPHEQQGFIGNAIDKVNETMGKHPFLTLGTSLGASFIHPAAGLAFGVPYTAKLLKDKQHWSALGNIGGTALGFMPGVGPWTRMIAPIGLQIGGDMMQQHQNQMDAAVPKYASHGGRPMARTKQALHPLLLAAAPLAKSMGVQAAIGAGMQGIGNMMGKRPLTEGVGSAAAMGGASGALSHGVGAAANKLGGGASAPPPGAAAPPSGPAPATPAPEAAKTAFVRNYKAAQAYINPERNMTPQRRYALMVSAMQKMAAYPKLMEKIGITDEEIQAATASPGQPGQSFPEEDKAFTGSRNESVLSAKGSGGPSPHDELSKSRKALVQGVGKKELEGATTGGALGRAGLMGLGGGAAGALGGGLAGAAMGKPITGGLTGGGAGLGGTLGYQGGNLLRLLLKSKGYGDVPGLQYAGAGLGGLAGGGMGYALSPEKEGSYQPRLLLSSLTNAARVNGRTFQPMAR